MADFDYKAVNADLLNWGRYVHDGWLERNLLIMPPPTSDGYMAPVVAYDDPEPVKMPVDHWRGKISEHVVISLGCEVGGFDLYRVLVHWYTRLAFVECTQDDRYKRLSKQMHCSFQGAQRMHLDAQIRYWDLRQVMEGLLKLCKRREDAA